jgi:small subunit ribosomal protein S8
MSFNDPISELLTRLRNAKDAQHRYVDLSSSKMRLKILGILKQNGFIENFLVNEELRKIRIFLKYNKNRKSVLNGLKRISSPGLRRYIGHQDIPRVFNGMGIAILTSSKGVLDGETARNLKVGGEILCAIW